MIELSEEKIKEIIKELDIKGFNPLERVILLNEGTVLTLLSVLFSVPIKVKVISQKEVNKTISRYVVLEAIYSEDVEMKIPVCFAHSLMAIEENREILKEIREKKLGIGQIIASKKLRVERELIATYNNKVFFAREYSIKGEGINIFITEVYPKCSFVRLIDKMFFEE